MYQSSASQSIKKKRFKIEESRFRFKFDDFSDLDGEIDSTKVELLSIDAVWWTTISAVRNCGRYPDRYDDYDFQVRLEPKTEGSFDVNSQNYKIHASAKIDDIELMYLEELYLSQNVLQTWEKSFKSCNRDDVAVKLKSIDSSGAPLVVEFLLSVVYDELVERNVSYRPTTMRNEIIANSSKMLENSTFSDFTFIVKGKEFKVHKVILGAASEVFLKLFTTKMEESEKNECKVTHIDPIAFEHMLRFVYGGKLPENFNAKMAQDLYGAAHYYDFKTLKGICEQEVLGGLNVDNALELHTWSQVYDLEELKREAWAIIKRDLLKIFFPFSHEPLTPADIETILENQANQKDFWKNFKPAEPKI